MEALEIKDIDTMIRGLERELKGVEVSEIMVTTPVPDVSAPPEVITITEDEIVATLPTQKPKTENGDEQESENFTPVNNSEIQEIIESPSKTEEVSTPLTETITEETPTIEEQASETIISEPLTPQTDPYQKTFDSLVKKIYDRNYDLGACFERNIEFESFMDNKLTWGSSAEGDDKKQLITHWGVINMFVKELFGFETKIVNIAKKKIDPPSVTIEETSMHEVPTHQDADSGSMIEDIEMKSSCIAPEAGETEAAKEKDPSTLLEEPMIKEAIALFDPKKVRIKRNT